MSRVRTSSPAPMIMYKIENSPSHRQDFILLVDFEFNGVLCSADNATIALATAMAYTNMNYFAYPTYTEHVSDEHKYGDFDDIENHFMIPDTWTIKPMTQDRITEKWINFRKEVIARKNAHDDLDRLCRTASVKAIDNYFLSSNLNYVTDQLNQCNVDIDFYTDPIHFYSSTTNCSNATAYNELKMLVESEGQRKFRIMTLYMKYRTKLNLSGVQDLPTVIAEAKRELYENSWV